MYTFQMCIKVFISTSILLKNVQQLCGLSLPIPTELDAEDLGEVVVSLKEDSGRYKRSTDGVSVPAKNIQLIFPFNEGVVDLHLIRTDEQSVNVPVYTTSDRGDIVRQYIQDKNNVFFYQDESKFAAFYLETTNSTSCVFGSFEDKSQEYFLEPKDRNCDPRNSPLFKVLKIKHTNIQYADSVVMDKLPNRLPVSQNSEADRQRRSTPEYKIEMLLIVDFSVYNYWYTQSTASTSGEKDTEAKANIRQFYAWVINGMDVRYKNIQTSAYTISIVFSGIYIADQPSKSPFTENNKDSSTPTPKVVAGTVLDDVTSWVQSSSGLPSHDHAMMFSRYDFTSSGSSSNAGLAWVGAVCTTRSVSIVEDHFNFIILTVAAHELGHSLSAEHDGTNNACNGADAYIMAASSSTPDNTNPWKFSSCSTTYFTNYINTLNSGSGNCMTSLSTSFDPTALSQYTSLPGQIYDADAMCKHIVGPGSSFCQFPYSYNFASLCTTLWCYKTDGSGQCESALGGDGLQCGNRKWCISGECVYDDCAPSGDESCLFGDRSGVIINFNGADKTCADIDNEPSICYAEGVGKKCCKTCGKYSTGRQGCEYGDTIQGCTSAYCPQYGDSFCCGTCYTGTTCLKLTALYRRRLGRRFKRCRVRRVRKGSLNVEYDVITDDEAEATLDVVTVAKDLVYGKENVTYDGQEAPVSSAAYVDTSGNNVNISITTTGCELLESSEPCSSGYVCYEGETGPYCRSSTNYDQQMLIIISAVVGAVCLIITTAVILVLCLCCKKQQKKEEKHRYGIENPAMIPDEFYTNGRLKYEMDSNRSYDSTGMSSPFYGRRWYPGYSDVAPNGTWHQQPMNNAKYSIPRPKY
ncbi:A disintegrin and metalloproteinase with thrombospondin motifs 6-like [Saccostrea cucullata]|uniref:A disintegrin and metalloproteinase with thrombospondin motifs 6-like n=1 Tax=Saccostrea cuccullata TaxID=36930 RepID=UPI002ED1B576